MVRVSDTWLVALRLTGLGWYVATCIIIGVVGGIGLDKLFGTKIIFFLLGTLLGVVIAFWGLYKMVQPILNASMNQGNKGSSKGKEDSVNGQDVNGQEGKR